MSTTDTESQNVQWEQLNDRHGCLAEVRDGRVLGGDGIGPGVFLQVFEVVVLMKKVSFGKSFRQTSVRES